MRVARLSARPLRPNHDTDLFDVGGPHGLGGSRISENAFDQTPIPPLILDPWL